MKNSSLLIVICFFSFFGLVITSSVNAKDDKDITGTWVVNEEVTDTLQDRLRKSNTAGRGFGTDGVRVVVGAPPSGGASGPNSTLKFPIVLECKEILFEVEEDKVKASCTSGVSRDFLIGKLHGRVTKFRRNVLTEYYSSTSRSVRHDIRVDKDGNLVAKVKIKPQGGISQTYVRVYSRPADDEASESETATDTEPEET